MRAALVVFSAMLGVALLLPVSETRSVPLSGVRLVGEQHPTTADVIAAGKNGKTGKKGNNGKNSDGPSTAAGAGGFFFGAERLGISVGPDLVPVALR